MSRPSIAAFVLVVCLVGCDEPGRSVADIGQAREDTRVCDDGVDKPGCPCQPDYVRCCVEGGNGLECIAGSWTSFSDGPCWPGTDEPFPGYCEGVFD